MTRISQSSPDLFDALDQRDAGMARVVAASDPDYLSALEGAICELARSGMEFTADDVRERAGDPPAGVHFNVAGAAIARAARSGLIVQTGFGISSRVVGHGNLVRKWRGAR